MRMNIEQVPKPSNVDADPVKTWGRLLSDSTRAKETLFGSAGALVTACWQQEFCSNTGSPTQYKRQVTRQLAARESGAGLPGMADRPVVLRKPGNAGGRKGP